MPRVSRKSAGKELTSADWNAVADYVNAVANSRGGAGIKMFVGPGGFSMAKSGGRTFHFPAVPIFCSNIGTVNLKPLDAIAFTEPLNRQGTTPDYVGSFLNEDMMLTTPDLQGKTPWAPGFGRFGIVVNFIEVGFSGLVWVAGVVPCWLHYPAEYTENFSTTGNEMFDRPDRADTMPGQTYLQASEVGAAQILWMADPLNATNDTRLALVRLAARNTDGIGIADYDSTPYNSGISEVVYFPSGIEIQGAVNANPRLSHGIVKLVRT